MNKLSLLLVIIASLLACLWIGIYLGSSEIVNLRFIANKPIIKVPLNTQTLACGSQILDPIIKDLRKVTPGIRLEEAPLHNDEFDYPALKWRERMKDGTEAYFVYPLNKAYFIYSKELDPEKVEEIIVNPLKNMLSASGYTLHSDFDIPVFGWGDGTFTRKFGFSKQVKFDESEPILTENAKMVLDISLVPMIVNAQLIEDKKELLIGLTCASTFEGDEMMLNLDYVYEKFKSNATVEKDTTIEYVPGDAELEINEVNLFKVIPNGGRMNEGFNEYWMFDEDGTGKLVERLRTSVDCEQVSKAGVSGRCYDSASKSFK